MEYNTVIHVDISINYTMSDAARLWLSCAPVKRETAVIFILDDDTSDMSRLHVLADDLPGGPGGGSRCTVAQNDRIYA